jgi:glutathione S-transferase
MPESRQPDSGTNSTTGHVQQGAATSMPTLVSHALCPYVQRASIVLTEKGVPFQRRDIDLGNKPDWFLARSPLGKTPLLLVGEGVSEAVIFESSVICEYLEEVYAPPHAPALYPPTALARAQQRAWMEFGSSVLNAIAAFYNAPDETALHQKIIDLHDKFGQVEAVLAKVDGPFFGGADFCMVDAVFAPVFRYFEVLDGLSLPQPWAKQIANCTGAWPRVTAWRAQLAKRPSVQQAVSGDYPALLLAFLQKRPSMLGRLLTAPALKSPAI